MNLEQIEESRLRHYARSRQRDRLLHNGVSSFRSFE